MKCLMIDSTCYHFTIIKSTVIYLNGTVPKEKTKHTRLKIHFKCRSIVVLFPYLPIFSLLDTSSHLSNCFFNGPEQRRDCLVSYFQFLFCCCYVYKSLQWDKQRPFFLHLFAGLWKVLYHLIYKHRHIDHVNLCLLYLFLSLPQFCLPFTCPQFLKFADVQ